MSLMKFARATATRDGSRQRLIALSCKVFDKVYNPTALPLQRHILLSRPPSAKITDYYPPPAKADGFSYSERDEYWRKEAHRRHELGRGIPKKGEGKQASRGKR